MNFVGKGKIGINTYSYDGDQLSLPVRAEVFKSDVDIVRTADAWSGYIIVSRWQPLEKKFAFFRQARNYSYQSDDLRFNFLANIFLADRQVNNILIKLGVDYFSGERKLLDRLLKLTLARHQLMFDLNKQNVKDRLAGYDKEIRLIRLKIGKARSLIKKDFLSYWEAIGTGRDILGRVNKQAIGSKLIAAANRLQMRLEAINNIYQKIQVRAAATHALIQEAEYRIKSTEDLIRQLLANLEHGSTIPAGVRGRMCYYYKQLSALDYNPVCSQSDYIKQLLYSLEDLSKNIGGLSEKTLVANLYNCYRVLRVKRIQFVMEEMIAVISRWLNGERNSRLKFTVQRKGALILRWFRIYEAEENADKSARYIELRELFRLVFQEINLPGKKGKSQWLEIKQDLIDISKLIN